MITYIVEVVSLLLNCVGVCLLVNAKTSFNLRMAKFKEKTKDNEENLKYNTEQYPKDVAAFEKQYKVMCDEEVKKINAAHKFINDNFAKIEQIDIVSFTQAKYAQYLLDNIYRGAESIKEAFAMLDSNMDKIEYKPATTVKTTATKDAQTKGKKGWARLSKLAKAMIIVPIITVGLPILWWIVAAILQNNPDTLVFVVGTGLIIGFVSYGLIGATAVFESIGAAILIYRKIKKDWKK